MWHRTAIQSFRDFFPTPASAGLTVLMNHRFHYEIAQTRTGGEGVLIFRWRVHRRILRAARGQRHPSSAPARFDWFDYIPLGIA
ncbi:hypothetical protein EHV15_15520 [Paenibacillus oralis]|uniref:Uncharacterized protein n=1 Tax=Paenibacillus oralis TaxID=2490856 RepID=A0A3P3U1F9_9BACL|nr:hypothetical protein [Paenibacillus oralis]RRJ64172.1 hypothetical protein EHV15_15520 [Paenibacillus oralis]